MSNITESLYKNRPGIFTFCLCYRDAAEVEDRGGRLVCVCDNEGILIFCLLFIKRVINTMVTWCVCVCV